MRWNAYAPIEGDIRTKTRFLLFPMRIGNIWKWLEFAAWEEKYISVVVFDIPPADEMMWVPIKWV